MKITNEKLIRIIKEELDSILNEERKAFVFIDPSGNLELQNVSLDDSQNWNIPAKLLDNQSYNALMRMNGKPLGQQGAQYFFNMIKRLNANPDKLNVDKLSKAMVVTNR